ncbi:MAG: prolyl oligopeptidase family serine peptidase [archaeon GBS-70-058]|nr:prolyl oligopeptidase family serine peptidase [Candidatus Culexarchaeum nevadense]
MNTGDFDPYMWLENLNDPNVIQWALERSDRARMILEPLSRKLMSRISKYYSLPYVISVDISKSNIFILLRDGRSFKIGKVMEDGLLNEIVKSEDIGDDVVIQGFQLSEEGDKLAFSFSIGGADEGITRILDVKSNEVLDELKGRIGSIVWLNEERYYYVRFYGKEKTPDGIPPPAQRVFLREKGTEEMVFGEGLPSLHFIGLKKSLQSNKALLSIRYGWTKSDVYVGKITDPNSWSFLYGGGDFITYPIDYLDGKYIVASFDGEGMGRLLAINEKNYEVNEILGEQPYPLEEAVICKDRIVASYLVNASAKIKLINMKGKWEEISFEPPGTVSSLNSNGEKCVFKYESFLIPYRIYLIENGKTKIICSNEVEGGFEIREFWVESKDYTKIHAFKVQNKNKQSNFVFAYGYGGFRISLTPRFHPHVIPFIEDGGVFVIANLRGGGEYGEKWHRAGMRENKQNVFNDFIAVLEHLKREGAKIVAYGVSNGGLLVGAILTQRPDLIDGALIGYPVLDMLRFDKLYIGRTWVTEYGDPENPKDREYLIRYSPYHNITRREYPPVMIFTGLYDDRVHPAHALKFAAKMEEIGAPYLLRVERKSGHSGATPQTRIEEYSDIMAFVYHIFRMQ